MSADAAWGSRVDEVPAGGESVDPEVLGDIERRITDIARLATAVEASGKEAAEASEAAKHAKAISSGLFRPNETTKALQDAVVEGAEAIVALAESQKHLFENQQALAADIRELTAYALKSVGTTRAVYHRLRVMLEGGSNGQLHELAERELRRVMLEFRQQLDLAERQELSDRRLRELRDELASQRVHADREAETIAEVLNQLHRDLDERRGIEGSFADALRSAAGRLDELDRRVAVGAERIEAEVVRGSQRDEETAQQLARLGARLWLAIGVASVGAAAGLSALIGVLTS